MKDDIELGTNSTGIGVRANKAGISLHLWYDSSLVGDGFWQISWEQLDEIRKRGKRRVEIPSE